MEDTQKEFEEENEFIKKSIRSRNKALCSKCSKRISYSTFGRHFLNCGRHICQECGKKYSYAFELKDHQKTHVDANVYNCKYCNKTLCNSYSYQRHLRSRFHYSNKNFVLKQNEKTVVFTLKEVKCLPDKMAKIRDRAPLERPTIISVEEMSLSQDEPLMVSFEEVSSPQEESLIISFDEDNSNRKPIDISFEEEDFPHEQSHRSIKEENFMYEKLDELVEDENFSDERDQISFEVVDSPYEESLINDEDENFPDEQSFLISIEEENSETDIPQHILKDKTNIKEQEEYHLETTKFNNDNTTDEFQIITIERMDPV